MKRFFTAGLALLAAAGIIAAIGASQLPTPQTGNTQDYYPNRYAVIAAEINVLSPQMGASNKRQCVMLKFDTATGKAWILQIHVAGGNDPKVRNSGWHEVGILNKNNR